MRKISLFIVMVISITSTLSHSNELNASVGVGFWSGLNASISSNHFDIVGFEFLGHMLMRMVRVSMTA